MKLVEFEYQTRHSLKLNYHHIELKCRENKIKVISLKVLKKWERVPTFSDSLTIKLKIENLALDPRSMIRIASSPIIQLSFPDTRPVNC